MALDTPLTGRLAEVLALYPFELGDARASRAPSGLIQETHLVTVGEASVEKRLVVQKIHPVFDTPGLPVLDDLDAVTTHLASRGLETPRLVRARSGETHVRDTDGRAWRVLTFLDGHTVDRVEHAGLAEAAGALVARFHAAVDGLAWEFRFVRAGVHDTTAHLARLEAARTGEHAAAAGDAIRRLADTILRSAGTRPTWSELPRRVTHGDLKISNVLFVTGSDGERARALLDLDTLGRQVLAYELGDALRSWCNPLGEDVEATRFDEDVFAAAVHGYARGASQAGLRLADEERACLVPGVLTVSLELAARFCVDAFEDRYFGWDPARFPSRREHNRVRAAGQLALAQAIEQARGRAEVIVHQTFRR